MGNAPFIRCALLGSVRNSTQHEITIGTLYKSQAAWGLVGRTAPHIHVSEKLGRGGAWTAWLRAHPVSNAQPSQVALPDAKPVPGAQPLAVHAD